MATTKPVPTVMIVGAGIGGLMLGILLEQINVPYHIFERATAVRPLGAVMTLGTNILSVFEQLGLIKELEEISLYCPSIDIYNDETKLLGSINLSGHKAVAGYDNFMFPRPKLFELLMRKIPASKVSLGKKVLRTEEKEGKVIIHCSDGSSYVGDILVGSDGAYSGVRQSLYRRLLDKGLLPKEDQENLAVGYVSMVGVAEGLDPEKFTDLKDNYSHFYKVVGKDTKGFSVATIPGKRIGWLLTVQLSEEEAKVQQFRNSEWGPEANEAMLKDFEDMLCPWGRPIKEVFDATPKDLMSKVFLEEKLFTTWYHGRTVLLGDACHKMLPSAGQGAVNAIQDAVVLANCIYNLTDISETGLTEAFKDYYNQRFARSGEQIKRSATMSSVLMGQTLKQKVVRHVFLKYLPEWATQRSFEKTFQYRPQIAWLPLAENRGTGAILPQECKRFDDKIV
ncbi:hypothetical protein BGZ46_002523 [Entomortierella lignicola]|nr:hypothetical protein BGZ46_002523 [Entomortierella lignicola]